MKYDLKHCRSAMNDELADELVLQLTAALATHPVPEVYFPKTVHDAEGFQSYPIPDTKGILLHLILPHSLRCPADTYFTQAVSHYPHLHRESDTGELRYGHFEDPLPSIASLRLPVDMQGQHTTFPDTASSTGPPLSPKMPTLTARLLTQSSLLRASFLSLLPPPSD